MITRSLALLAAAGMLLVGTPAAASDVTSTTRVRHGVVETFVDVIPSCEGGGPRYTITTTSNIVRHRTVFDDGGLHVAFTVTGTFVAEPKNDPSLPGYTGKFTQTGGFNGTNHGGNGRFTFSVRGTSPDGSSFANHSTEHFGERPDGSVHEFFHCT